MKLLTYKNIVELITNRRALKEWAFNKHEYYLIADSCENDKVLTKILIAYSPQHFDLLYKNARERVLGNADPGMLDVHDPIFSEGRAATKLWLKEQTSDLTPENIEQELHTTHKNQIMATLADEVQNGLLRRLYPTEPNRVLHEHYEDFRDFIEHYLFGFYQKGATGSENLVRALHWALTPNHSAQKDRLFALFSSLNSARIAYAEDIKKYIDANHEFSKGRERNWSCLPGIDERILDGLSSLRLSLQDDAQDLSFEDNYTQFLVHDFVHKTSSGLLPSAELYSAYLQAVLPDGYVACIEFREEYSYCIDHANRESIISCIAEGIAERDYKKLLEIGKALSQTIAIQSESDYLITLSEAGQRSATGVDYSLIEQFFPFVLEAKKSMNHNKKQAALPNLVKLAFTGFLTQTGFDLEDPLTKDEKIISALKEKIKSNFYKKAYDKMSLLLDRTYASQEEAIAQVGLKVDANADENHSVIKLVSTPKKVLVVTDANGTKVDIEAFLSMIDAEQNKNILQEKIANNTGMSQEWLSLLNAVFEREGSDLWDLCRRLLAENDAKIVHNEGKLHPALVNEFIADKRNKLIALGKYYNQNFADQFLYYYATDTALVTDLLTTLTLHIINSSFDELIETAQLCDEQTMMKCLESGLWNFIPSNLKYNFVIQLVSNDYDLALESNHIRFEQIPNKEDLLRAAIMTRKVHLVGKLLAVGGLDLNQKDFLGYTLLTYAALFGNIDVFTKLIAEKDINLNEKDSCGETAFMVAAERGHSDIVFLLLEHNDDLNLNEKNNTGETALILATKGRHIDIVRELIQYDNLDLNAQCNSGDSALTIAIARGYNQIAMLLLDYEGLNINQKNNDGEMALTLAAARGSTTIVSLLLEYDISSLNKENNNGETALTIAVASDRIPIVSKLIEYDGLNINHKINTGDTALTLAASRGNMTIVSLLLDYNGLNVNEKNNQGDTALMIAIANDKIEAVVLLLNENELNLNEKNNRGDTALIVAAANDNIALASLLLKKDGLELDLQNEDGDTAFSLAKQNNNQAMLKLLQDYASKQQKHTQQTAVLGERKNVIYSKRAQSSNEQLNNKKPKNS